MQLVKEYKKLSPTMKFIVVLVVIIMAYYIFHNVKAKANAIKNIAESKAEIQQIKSDVEAHEDKGEKPTMTFADYQAEANKLYNAMNGFGTDDDAVEEVFNSIQNNVDFLKLKAAFGTREGSTWQQWLDGDLNQAEKDAINQSLDAKGIIYKI